MGCWMTKYWWQSTVALLAIFVLGACNDATSQTELEQVVSVSTASISPSPTLEPSATPLPTETATFTPTPQPSPTPQEPTITPTPDIPLGQVRDGPDTGAVEVWVGEWVTPPVAEGFDSAYVVVEDGNVNYRSPGLTQEWSPEQQAWVFPETFPNKVGEVVPVSLMGGRLEIADQAAAWQAHQDMVLAWLNNPANIDFSRAVYGKDVITFEDLAVHDANGQVVAYEIKLTDQADTKIWPKTLGVGSYGDVNFNSLGDTVNNPDGINTIDVSSPLWVYFGWKEWLQSVGPFVNESTTGPNSLIGAGWSVYGLRFTHEGRLVYLSGSKEYFESKYPDIALVGGESGGEVNPDLAEYYLGSMIKAYTESYPGIPSATGRPFNADPTIPNRIRLGLVEGDEAEYGYAGLFE